MNKDFDVVIVGAGPVGLLLAIELSVGGARPLVLERLAAVNPTLKALGIGPLGAEALQRRGMGAAVLAAEEQGLAAMEQAGTNVRGRMGKFSGHFAGLFLRKDAQSEPARRMRAVAQQSLEAVLAERARTAGVEVRRECEVTGFAQGADGIEVRWNSPAGEDCVRVAYLVGCDGGRSPVRKLAGFAFPGPPPTMTMYQAVVEVDHPERLLPVGWHRAPGGVYSYGAFPNRLFMGDFSGPPVDRQAPVTREEIEETLRRVSGKDVRIKTLRAANRWADNTRLADTYRRGRVLLAGDAAHVHSPLGGQGLNLGLTDAANLGWKLAAVVRGDMPDTLLDTYTAERRPVAEAVLANTQAQTAMLRPDPQSGAMRDILEKLLQLDEVNRFLGEAMRGLAVRYDLGAERNEVGRLVADRPINGDGVATSLYELMQDARGVLLDATAGGTASRLVTDATPRVRCVRIDKGSSMLLRPDACVAWVGEESSTDGLGMAVRRWFNPSAMCKGERADPQPDEGAARIVSCLQGRAAG